MAKSLNSYFVTGKVFNPEFKEFQGGSKCFSFSLAIDNSYKPQGKDWVNKTIYKPVKLWGKQAEAWQTLNKLDEVLISGSLDADEYEKDGEKKLFEYIRPNFIKMLHSTDFNRQSGSVKPEVVDDHQGLQFPNREDNTDEVPW